MIHIGKRIFKSFIGVLIGLGIYLLLYMGNHMLGFHEIPSTYVTDTVNWYVPTNFYTPFFVAIAVVYALQTNITMSKQQARIRSIGSVIGGYYGYIITMIFEYLCFSLLNYQKGTFSYYILLYCVTALGLFPLMKIIEKTPKVKAGFITLLTYFSVTISVRNGGMGAFLFTTNRVLSTVIGVNIAVYMNTIPHFKFKNKKILFLVALDDALLTKNKKLTERTKNHLSDLMLSDIRLTYMSSRPYKFIEHVFEGLNLKYPMITLNGSAVYDPVDQVYSNIKVVSHELRQPIENIIASYTSNAFSYVFNENELTCYYNDLSEVGSREFYEINHRANTKMVEAQVPERLDVSVYTVVEKNEVIEQLYQALLEVKGIHVYYYPFDEVEGYSYMRIMDADSNKHHAVPALKELFPFEYIVCVGGRITDLKAMQMADYAICLKSADEQIKPYADLVIDSDDPHELIKAIETIYHQRHFENMIKNH